MKKMLVALAALAGLFLGAAAHAQDAAKAKQLAQKYNCLACHAEDKKLVGPAYKDIAKKYKGDASAGAKLAGKVKAGGGGVWGTIPMPPNNVPDADIKAMVDWILAMQ
jgi:cytochrome c